MIKWFFILVIGGAILGYVYGKGKGGKNDPENEAASGAAKGLYLFIGILQFLLPFIIIGAILKACW